MIRPTPIIGCAHGILPERVTLGELSRLESQGKHRLAVWWARLLHGVEETSLSEAPANFFKEPQHGPGIRL